MTLGGETDNPANLTESIPLNDLSDVDTSGVATGDFLQKSAGDWVDFDLFAADNTFTGDQTFSGEVLGSVISVPFTRAAAFVTAPADSDGQFLKMGEVQCSTTKGSTELAGSLKKIKINYDVTATAGFSPRGFVVVYVGGSNVWQNEINVSVANDKPDSFVEARGTDVISDEDSVAVTMFASGLGATVTYANVTATLEVYSDV